MQYLLLITDRRCTVLEKHLFSKYSMDSLSHSNFSVIIGTVLNLLWFDIRDCIHYIIFWIFPQSSKFRHQYVELLIPQKITLLSS